MKVLRETIGGTEVYIQTLDDELLVVGRAPQEGRSTQVTGVEEGLQAAYQRVREVIKDIAQDLGAEFRKITDAARPDGIEMEFSLGVSTEGKVVWLVSGKSEFGMKVKVSWKLSADENHP